MAAPALNDWPEQDHAEFARLLEKFNASIDQLHLPGEPPEPNGAQPTGPAEVDVTAAGG